MQKVALRSQLPRDRGVCIEHAGQKILLVRDGESVRAFGAVCPHAGAPLDEGAICNGRIVCPWHKAAFSIADGSLVEPPALEGLTRYPVNLEGDDVFVDPEPIPAAQPQAASDDRTFLIVGAGAAGASAAAAFREFGFGGRIILVGKEPGLPFDRTSLSKFVLSGEMKPEETPLLKPEKFYTEQRIEVEKAEAKTFDVSRREVYLADGRQIRFDQALLAPGGDAKPIDVGGCSLKGVHVLRSREDAAAILTDIQPGARAIVLGSSFIGLEVAACLRAQKASVTVVAPEKIPFARQFGEQIGASIRALHEANGVIFETPAKASKLEGDDHVSALVLEDGRRLPADLVIVGVGVRPATDFITGAELLEDGGLVTDASMRVAEGVYAAGDIAVFPLSPDARPTRIEHWRVAQSQARVAAQNMLGGRAIYDAPPFFWTYHYGKNFEFLGHADSWDEQSVIGNVDEQDFVAFLTRGERVAAVVACGRQRLTAVLAERMRTELKKDEALRLAQNTL